MKDVYVVFIKFQFYVKKPTSKYHFKEKHEPTNSRPMLAIEDVAEFRSSTLFVLYMYSSHVLRLMSILYINEGRCDFKVHT